MGCITSHYQNVEMTEIKIVWATSEIAHITKIKPNVGKPIGRKLAKSGDIMKIEYEVKPKGRRQVLATIAIDSPYPVCDDIHKMIKELLESEGMVLI